MTVKQVIIWGSIYLLVNVVDVAVLDAVHMQKSIPLIMTIFWTLFSGIFLGGLQQKWKRDKEFAKIIADRLLQRQDTNTQSSATANPWNSLNNAGLAQSANVMSGMLSGIGAGSSQNALNSMLGANPVIGDVTPSKYPGTQG